ALNPLSDAQGTDGQGSDIHPRPPAGYAGTAQWHPPISDFGFYRVRVSMQSATGTCREREVTLAVLRPLPPSPTGEFGWTLAGGDRPLSLDELTSLLPQVGIQWLKFPVWFGEQEDARGDALSRFAGRLESKGIQVVGLLNQPSATAAEHQAQHEQRSAANLF